MFDDADDGNYDGDDDDDGDTRIQAVYTFVISQEWKKWKMKEAVVDEENSYKKEAITVIYDPFHDRSWPIHELIFAENLDVGRGSGIKIHVISIVAATAIQKGSIDDTPSDPIRIPLAYGKIAVPALANCYVEHIFLAFFSLIM